MLTSVQRSLRKKETGTTEKGEGRAREILQTAREIFANEGYAKFSMRNVAAHLQISLSTVQHYYHSKEILLEAVLLYMLEEYRYVISQIGQTHPAKTQTERFLTVIDLFIQHMQKTNEVSIFLEVWALAHRHEFAAKIVEQVRAREQEEIFQLLRGLMPSISEADCKIRTVIISALFEGLMVRFFSSHPESTDLKVLEAEAHKAFIQLAIM